jgi:hypothetical protein
MNMALSKGAQEYLKQMIIAAQEEVQQYEGMCEYEKEYKIAKEILDFLKTGLDD